MTIATFDGKRVNLAREHHLNQHCFVGMLCWKDWDASQNRWRHEERTLCGNTETTSQEISQEDKAYKVA